MSELSLESHVVSAAEGDVHYNAYGEGDAVVLLHGGGPGAYGVSNFRRNIAELAASRRVIIVDLPGYGGSQSRTAPGCIYDPLASAVLQVLDHAGAQRASLIGNSLGGGTALKVALDAPDRVDKLVLMGSGGSIPVTTPFPTEGLMRMLTYYDGEGPTIEKLRKVIDLLVFDPGEITDELLEERFRTSTLPQTLANPPLRGRGYNPADDLWRGNLYGLPHPALLLWGREDRVMPLDAAFMLLKTIPQAELHVFSRCGHWAQWEKADEFNALVTSFLDRA